MGAVGLFPEVAAKFVLPPLPEPAPSVCQGAIDLPAMRVAVRHCGEALVPKDRLLQFDKLGKRGRLRLQERGLVAPAGFRQPVGEGCACE